MTDSNRTMTIDNALLKALRHTDQIKPATNVTFCLEQEARSLYRLHQRLLNTSNALSPEQAYLTLYDCLFRHVSTALLNQGYQITSQQPHQTLRRIVRQSAPDARVQQMIAQRHVLKKEAGTLQCKDAVETLTRLLNNYDIRDAQACQTLCLLPLQRIVGSSTKHSSV
ncbi:hypothetical protein [Psychrobacter sp. Ps2]|uniref:hypothetical protein n=1 Tax=Psychrobacter sp. Ps2 TaxID=2790956 RepID=UPI001EDDEC10|nr:hypothetical protein [Psychrobacter sp. Ps2]MCG3858829.1 hypothetical protein [Psychrobacter sp. Ps2]